MTVTWPRVLRSEWIKLRSLRSTWFTLTGAVLAVVAIGTIVGYATNAHWSSIGPEERLRFEPISRSLVGVNLAQLIVGDSQPAGIADRLDLHRHPRGALGLDVLAPERAEALHQAARRIDLQILALEYQRAVAHALVA